MATPETPSTVKAKYTAAVIGRSGHGDYGHGLDTVWKAFDSIHVVGIADPDDPGRAEAQQRSGAKRAYRDYREMLANEKPDLVSIGPRHLDGKAEIVAAVADSGAHIYLEKPFAKNLAEADKMIEAIERNKVKVQIAHQMRMSPYALKVAEMIKAGKIGDVQEVRLRGKEDQRAGGEDLMVLGSHLCDLARMLLGDPKWVFSHVTRDGEEMKASHVHEATEPIGPIAGNQIAAMFAFDNGVHAYFGSRASDRSGSSRFGTTIYGSKGVINLPNSTYPKGQPQFLRAHRWMPDEKHDWQPIEATPAVQLPAEDRQLSNALMVHDLLEAIEQDREPVSSARDGLWSTEMIVSVYESQKRGARVDLPLKDRRHPLETV
jgi:predicted dehydrogenase